MMVIAGERYCWHVLEPEWVILNRIVAAHG